MSAASPTAFLLWAILSVLFFVFMIHHLWCYDRFKCLSWSAGRQPGTFKRVMTYSYLASVPLFVVYSVATTVIKYREGFIYTSSPDVHIIPTPINMYDAQNRVWVLPLNFVFSFAWALELVTHLEELTFWLYLLNQTPEKAEWFSSWEYNLWYMGSIVAIVGMPLTTLIARRNLLTIDAYIFLSGAGGSTSTTLAFLYVLWRFPRFIRHVKAEGADPSVVVRLATFYSLNLARVIFRFMFTLPLLVVALDAIIGSTHYINTHTFWTDLFQMIAGIGCFVSSAITLLIFFPRSIVREAGYKPRRSSTTTSPKNSPTAAPPFAPPYECPPSTSFSHAHLALHMGPWHADDTPPPGDADNAPAAASAEAALFDAPPYAHAQLHKRQPFAHSFSSPQLCTPLGSPEDVRVMLPPPARLARAPHAPAPPGSVPRAPAQGRLHPCVMTFTSPIDLAEIPAADSLP